MKSSKFSLAAFLRGDCSVFMCGFRPFFVLTALSASILMLIWLLVLTGWISIDAPGGMFLWHGHELVYGFVGAAIAGFVLTAIPEFTGATPISRCRLVRLVILWVLARIAYAMAGFWPHWLGLWPAMLLSLIFWIGILVAIIPPLWRDPQRRHLSFIWTLGALALIEMGFFLSAQLELIDGLTWLRVAVGLIMMLIIVAASRISMAVVNQRVEQGRPGQPEPEDVGYLARPPRRNLAIFTIAVCTATEFYLGDNTVTGWTALAASAAMLNLLNDWHVGRPLFTRWAFMMYTFYWLLAIGYALMGVAWLGAPLLPSAGRHLLMVGVLALTILTVMSVAGRIHAGQWLDRRLWIPTIAILFVVSAILRTLAGTYATMNWAMPLWLIAGGLWALSFAVYLFKAWKVLTGPRPDGLTGCEEPVDRHSDLDNRELG